MGLDIYLYRYQNFKETRAKEEEYEKKTEAMWKETGDVEYEKIPEETKESIRKQSKALAEGLGLDEWGSPVEPECIKIEDDHPKYPTHLFKIGYWRSSYNDSGINHVLENLIGETLYTIIPEGNNEDYAIQPDWGRVKKNAARARKRYLAHVEKYGPLRIYEIDKPWRPTGVTSPREAIAQYCREVDKRKSTDADWYGTGQGESYMITDPMQVVAIIPGTRKYGLGAIQDVTYVVFKSWDPEFYTQALEIIEATADYVLAHKDKDKFYLHWSG
jgi:hypothetical protein